MDRAAPATSCFQNGFPEAVLPKIVAAYVAALNHADMARKDFLMEIEAKQLRHLITKRTEEIERSVAGTGYLAKTVIGVGTFLLDNESDYDLLTAKQKVTFDTFLKPLLAKSDVDHGPACSQTEVVA
jgi:hypothetical protein